jgi:hypothetical protein
VPREVEHARDAEQQEPEEGDPVRRRECVAQRDPARAPGDRGGAQHHAERCGSRVEQRVPRREERVIDLTVGVRPQVDVEAPDQPHG